jgi:plastocyanin
MLLQLRHLCAVRQRHHIGGVMKRISLFAGGALALVAISAHAIDHTVVARAGPNRFDPLTLQINVGDTVTFMNDPDGPGFHNVKSDTASVTSFRCANGCDGDGAGGDGNPSTALWSATVAFPTAGSAPFHCEVHGTDGGGGMHGTITIVNGGGSPAISVDPTSLSGAAEEGSLTTVPLSVINSGDADLTWNADTATTDCTAPDLVPWLSMAPTSGTVVAGDPPANVDVTMDAATLTAGVYNANVCVHSNDAANDPVSVPVEFTVSIPDLIFSNGFDP